MAATFEEKLDALRKIRERQLAKKAEAAAPSPPAENKTAKTVIQSEDEGGVAADVDALFCTAHCYERGIHGCKTNLPTALQLYRLAAEQGHAVSQWRLGELLESGLSGQTEPDFVQAQKWYTLAAESGNVQAQNALALMLEEGRGSSVPADAAQALTWHLRAAQQGNALSQFCSASLLSKRGDDEMAMGWLKKSADQGFAPAERVLMDLDDGPAPSGAAPEDDDDLVSVARRVAEQLKKFDDLEAEGFLEEFLQECPPIALQPGLDGVELSEVEDED